MPLAIDRYVTYVDLGTAGALLTRCWDRAVVLTGDEGERMKEFISRAAVDPPTTAAELLVTALPGAGPDWS